MGRPGEEGLEKTAGRRTGVRVQHYETANSRKAEKALLELLQSGEPVMLYVDMAFLPYLDLPEGYHFGGHAIVATKYDANSQGVLVADRDGELHPVPLEILALARGSTFQPFPPKNRCLTFDFSLARPTRPDELWDAIRETSTAMLHPPIANLGVPGILTASKRIVKWIDLLTEAELRQTCLETTYMIDAAGGTGGGIFRYMYGRFLQEAAFITGDYALTELGADMILIGDEWQNVVPLLQKAAEADNATPLLNDTAYLLNTIAKMEQALWTSLAERAKQPV